MNRFLVVLAVILPFALSMMVISCGDEDFRHKDLAQEDGHVHAKDMTADMSCEVNDVVIEDCYDACSCCHLGQEDAMADCVNYCNGILYLALTEPWDPTRANYTGYKECVVGCVSLCGSEDDVKGECWQECSYYLDV